MILPLLICHPFNNPTKSSFIFVNVLLFMLLQLSQYFPTLPPSAHFHSQSPFSCPCPWVLHIRSLTHSSPSFKQSPPPSSPHTAVSLFHDSMPLVLFCSLVYFVHQIPLISDITWYFPFSDWLISLSIMLSRSIHAIVKGGNSFFILCCIVFHCVSALQFFNPLIY